MHTVKLLKIDSTWDRHLSGGFREVMDLGRWSIWGVRISAWAIVWDRNKGIDIGEWSICGGGLLERLYCTCRLYLENIDMYVIHKDYASI